MTDIKTKYTTAAALTLTLASLASDANLLIGRESTAIDNQTDLFIDVSIGGKIKLGTSPTASKLIQIFAYGSYDGTIFTGSLTGADAGATLIDSTKGLLVRLAIIPTVGTTGQVYSWGPVSLFQAFGHMPRKWGLWVVHSTGVNLDSTGGNHEVKATGIHGQTV
jgi:hypothetical protein